jgi:hypothetical protein
MAGVPECIRRSRKHLIKSNTSDARALQLEAAKQILAEVFHTHLCDVEDMIMRRLEMCRPEERGKIKENGSCAKWGTWPEMFLVEDRI